MLVIGVEVDSVVREDSEGQAGLAEQGVHRAFETVDRIHVLGPSLCP